MSTVIASDTVLQSSGHCVARPQKDGYLFYQYRTDELHLVPPAGYYIFQLCDGLRTVGEIERLLTDGADAAAGTVAGLRDFLERLLARGILEVADV